MPCNSRDLPADSEPGDQDASDDEEGAAEASQTDTNNRSASGRSGRYANLAPLMNNPTFRMAVGGDPLRAHHVFVLAPAPTHASRGTEHLLVTYVGGVGARAMRRTRSNGSVWLLSGDGEGDGKPRLFVELPG